MESWSELLARRAPELFDKALEHLLHLTLAPVALAILIGVPIGIAITRFGRWRGPVLSTLGLVQTLPSLAILALLIPLLGIGKRNAIVALTIYALFPIVMNTTTGLLSVPADVREAARGLGFTSLQRLRMVELPLALPVIVAGIRTAAVIDVGIATLASAVGAGGLGDFIFRGLKMDNHRLTILGAGSAMVLAVVVFTGIGGVERVLSRGRR